MSLRDEQKREIAQLMFVARLYLTLGTPEGIDSAITMGVAKDEFKLTGPLSESARRHTIIGAHLASAATRLVSVEDVLKEAGCPRPLFSACRDYFNKGRGTTDPRGHTCSEWFHIMFRVAVGHGEPDQASTSEKKKTRYRGRQDCLEHTPFVVAYAKLREIEVDLAAFLQTHHGIVAPT
jgi:hypothetical protein